MIAPLGFYKASQPTILTSYERAVQGDNKGPEFRTPHEINEYPIGSDTSCVEISAISKNLITPSVLDDYLANLSLPSDQTTAICTFSIAPIVESDSLLG